MRHGILFTLSFMVVAGGCGPSGGGGGGSPDFAMVGGGGRDLATGPGPSDGGMPPSPRDLRFDNDAFWAQDPPPRYCALDGGMIPPPMIPGGTPECPDDKNREGCPCAKEGLTASCWPGLRVNRNLGVCMDGMTTCQSFGEVGLAWGPCKGYVLPVEGAAGREACKCFSGGTWKIDNLSPCFYDSGGGPGSGGAASTVVQNGKAMCVQHMGGGPLMKPNQPWSTDTVTVDCQGRFKLCYTLKAGDVEKPDPNDCVLAEACVEADYTMVGVPQPFPVLPAWVSNNSACAKKFATVAGYGEMSVDGISVLCDQVKKVFLRVGYCPLSCNQMPNDPKCQKCMQGGSGNF